MIVLDTSAAVDFFTGAENAEAIDCRLADEFVVNVPALFDLEVLQALRGLDVSKQASLASAENALQRLKDFRAFRYGHEILRPRIWELRHNFAAYVALAELLDATLITCDRSLARSKGHSVSVELV